MCLAWSAVAEGGLALTKVVSVDEDRIMVSGRSPRPLNTKESVAHRADKPPLLSGRFVSDALRWSLHAVAQRCLAYEEKAGR